MDQFTYLDNNISSTENDVNTRIDKTLTVIDRLSAIWKSDLSKKKTEFFPATLGLKQNIRRKARWELKKNTASYFYKS